MAVILDGLSGIAQMLFVLLLAPAITGLVRKIKAQLLLRQGPPVLQPYRNLARMFRKEMVLAQNASWLFRAAPYLVFALTLVAAALVPTVATEHPFAIAADLIAIIASLDPVMGEVDR